MNLTTLTLEELLELSLERTQPMPTLHQLRDWVNAEIGKGKGHLHANHPVIMEEEQEKRIKYNDLVANAVAIQNVIDLTRAVRQLIREGYPVKREDLAVLSPYQTRHIKRFGDYILTPNTPEPFDGELVLAFAATTEEGVGQQATA